MDKLAPKYRSIEFIVVPHQCYSAAMEMECPYHVVTNGTRWSTTDPRHDIYMTDRMFFYAWDLWSIRSGVLNTRPLFGLSTASLVRRDRFARDMYRLIMEEVELESALVTAYAIGTPRLDIVEAWVAQKTKR